jgi:hypothetical protein
MLGIAMGQISHTAEGCLDVVQAALANGPGGDGDVVGYFDRIKYFGQFGNSPLSMRQSEVSRSASTMLETVSARV